MPGLSNYPPGVSGNEPQIAGYPDTDPDGQEYGDEVMLEYDWVREQSNSTLVRKYGELQFKCGKRSLDELEQDALTDIEVELHSRKLLEES